MINLYRCFVYILQHEGMLSAIKRIIYSLAARVGLLELYFPVQKPFQRPSYSQDWVTSPLPFFVVPSYQLSGSGLEKLEQDIQRYRTGEYCYFRNSWLLFRNWHTDPITWHSWNKQQHWSRIHDFTEIGDIKNVWEPARFACIYDFIRYQHHTGLSTAEDVKTRILDWIEQNPVHQGVHWKCSQEISIRVLNWTFALHYYKNDWVNDLDDVNKILHSIEAQINYVWRKRWYARTWVRNNHVVTEAVALYTVGLLFPFFSKSTMWLADGQKTFENEIERQIARDGTYLQYSFVYHRMVVQLLTWFIRLSQLHRRTISPVVTQRAEKSIFFLKTCMDDHTGRLPNYGHNDGTLLFPLSSSDYLDFRPSLQALETLISGRRLFTEGEWEEESAWIGNHALLHAAKKSDPIKEGITTFPEGGYAIIRQGDSMAFMRYGSHRHRPAQADHLHFDLWHCGHNLLQDAGSYRYHTSSQLKTYFQGTQAHNTVMLNHYDQMQKGPRFIWYHWIQKSFFESREAQSEYYMKAIFEGFGHIQKGITHQREIIKTKNEFAWKITDQLNHTPVGASYQLLWHPSCRFSELYSLRVFDIEQQELFPQIRKGYVSNYYGSYATCDYWVYRSDSPYFTTLINRM